jgi:UDP-glucose 4-epimerase
VNNGEEMENIIETGSPNLNIKGTNKSVLVVGGAGYIGSHTSKELKKHGFTPVVVDRDITSKPWATQYGPAYELNLPQNIETIDEIVKR